MNEIFNHMEAYFGYHKEIGKRVDAMWEEHNKLRYEIIGLKDTVSNIEATVKKAAQTIESLKLADEVIGLLKIAVVTAGDVTNNMKHLEDSLKTSREQLFIKESGAKNWLGLSAKEFKKFAKENRVQEYIINARKYYLKSEIVNRLSEKATEIEYS